MRDNYLSKFNKFGWRNKISVGIIGSDIGSWVVYGIWNIRGVGVGIFGFFVIW